MIEQPGEDVANAWNESDLQITRLLNAWRAAYASKTYQMYLYSNDYTPNADTVSGDFTNASFPNYTPQSFVVGDFNTASVTDHVAVLVLNHAVVFQASMIDVFFSTVYGYVVYDEGLAYLWSERFENPIELTTGSKIEITPRLKHAVCAPS